jgi:uncharacterized protein (TIGR02145 family)
MKTTNQVLLTTLLMVLGIGFENCAKEAEESTPSVWNYTSFTDSRDGKVYKSIQIGTQEWMTENLSYKTSAGSWIYWNDESLGEKYGRLYTWDAAKEAVPAGWHLPTDDEWKKLEITLGMSQSEADGIDNRGTNEGNKLKTTKGWENNNNGTDAVGFAALPGGFRSNSGSFLAAEYYAYWWSATENSVSNAWIRLIVSSNSTITRNFSYKADAYSVRCIKD